MRSPPTLPPPKKKIWNVHFVQAVYRLYPIMHCTNHICNLSIVLSSHLTVVLKCGRFTTMTHLTCTCHEILQFVIIFPHFMLFQIDYHRRQVGKLSSLSYGQASVEI